MKLSAKFAERFFLATIFFAGFVVGHEIGIAHYMLALERFVELGFASTIGLLVGRYL